MKYKQNLLPPAVRW